MKNKSQLLYGIGVVLGALLIVYALVFLRGEEVKHLGGICIGVGAGMFGGCLSMFLNNIYEYKHPEVKHQKDIEMKDERNTLIRAKAGARVNSIMLYLLSIVAFVFIFLDLPLTIILVMWGLILTQGILLVTFYNYYSKRL